MATDPARRTRIVETSDGWELAVESIPATGPARATLLLGHAMMTDRRSLDRPRGEGLASTLAARGFAVELADLRGHGESGPKAGSGAVIRYQDIVERDLPALLADVGARAGGPVAIVGNSLMANASMATLGRDREQRERVDAFVAIAANLWLAHLQPRWPDRLLRRGLLAFWATLARRRGYFPARRFGMGSEDVSAAYIDEFRSWLRSGRWGPSRVATDWALTLSTIRCPVLAVTGRGDRWLCPPREGRAFADQLTSAPVTHWVEGRESGLPFDPGHVALVADLRARPLWDRIADWLHEVLP